MQEAVNWVCGCWLGCVICVLLLSIRGVLVWSSCCAACWSVQVWLDLWLWSILWLRSKLWLWGNLRLWHWLWCLWKMHRDIVLSFNLVVLDVDRLRCGWAFWFEWSNCLLDWCPFDIFCGSLNHDLLIFHVELDVEMAEHLVVNCLVVIPDLGNDLWVFEHRSKIYQKLPQHGFVQFKFLLDIDLCGVCLSCHFRHRTTDIKLTNHDRELCLHPSLNFLGNVESWCRLHSGCRSRKCRCWSVCVSCLWLGSWSGLLIGISCRWAGCGSLGICVCEKTSRSEH